MAGGLDGADVEFVRREINGAPAVLVLLGGGPDTVVSVDVTAGGLIACVHLVRNPEKPGAVTAWPARGPGPAAPVPAVAPPAQRPPETRSTAPVV